ncbi:MAG: CpsD/CapB family tyrosine-protein kinase [Gammaproteobacteria bacterium]
MNIIEKAISLRDASGRTEPARHDPAGRRRKTRSPGSAPGTLNKEPAHFGRLREIGMLPDPETDQQLIEQLRHLKRPILHNSFGPLAEGVANVVMVTSARPGAGKSFVSSGLAFTLTRERELSVVLVDLDNIKATLTRGLELRDRTGFFDAADDESVPLESTLIDTEIPGLRIVPTGRQTQDSAELLNSERAKQLIRRLSDDDPGRIIILDTPPLLSTPDAHAILDLAHQIIIVVEAGVTKQSELKQIVESLRGNKPVGLVLNKSVGGLSSMYGGDYYAGPYEAS